LTQNINWRPFQAKILDMANDNPSDRLIYWFYSLQGNMGKSRLVKELIRRNGALHINPNAARKALDLIRKQLSASPQFEVQPILIFDLARAAPTHFKKLYETLETVQGSFSDSGGTVTWSTPPHVFVFANKEPETGKLSADRLRVHLITKAHTLMRASHIEKKLKAEHERLDEQQTQEEEAARSGELPPRLLTPPESFRSGGAGSSGAGSSGRGGGISEAAKATVVAHLRGLVNDGPFEEAAGSIVKLRSLIGTGVPENKGYIPKSYLLRLGSPSEVEQAIKPNATIPSSLLANLKDCIVTAWPNCTVENQSIRGGSVRNHKFNGYYVDGLKLKPPA
jgi:hypothetical protein